MEPSAALEKLREVSAQIETAVIADRGGDVLASTIDDGARSQTVARAALELLGAAERRQPAGGGFAQLEVALQGGSVFVVSHGDRLIAATTAAEPTVGLVFYDLKSALRNLDEPEAKPKKPRPARKTSERA
jgi:predicted regulator of Ras-like GTPase activity (Roadblock/LC7/MglB family)